MASVGGVITTVLATIAAVIVLVLVHELGHFIAARLAGVKCPEFFVGFGPRIWSTRRGDTEFGIKWILVGGYVKVLGMNPEEEVSPEDFPRSYRGVSYGKRFWIIFAGSLSHVLLALVLMFFTIWIVGYPDVDRPTNTIASVGMYMDEAGTEETPAYAAGLREGDTILAMDGEEVGDWEAVRSFIKAHPGEEVVLLIRRDGEEIEVPVRLAALEDGTGYLGVSPSIYMQPYSFFGAMGKTVSWFGEATYGVGYGIYRVFNWSTIKQLLGLAEPTVERPQTVYGIARTAGRIAEEGAFYFLNFFSFILLFLAYINLLPLPPLDGGHLAVLLWEKVTGREVDLRKLYPVAVAVLAFFALLFILTLRLDITSPINFP
ncbi:MAG: PDZ domain-containing protein [Actinobacteria bacterium]|nr:PDZ domain-containing protein [Actinomycetota bacterium]